MDLHYQYDDYEWIRFYEDHDCSAVAACRELQFAVSRARCAYEISRVKITFWKRRDNEMEGKRSFPFALFLDFITLLKHFSRCVKTNRCARRINCTRKYVKRFIVSSIMYTGISLHIVDKWWTGNTLVFANNYTCVTCNIHIHIIIHYEMSNRSINYMYAHTRARVGTYTYYNLWYIDKISLSISLMWYV